MSGDNSSRTENSPPQEGAGTTPSTGSGPHAPSNELDKTLLELLVCPFTKMPLSYDAKRGELVSKSARLAFPIRHGVPLMTRDAARHLDDPAPAGSDDEA